MKRFIVKEILPFAIILIFVAVLTLVPYFSNRSQIQASDRQITNLQRLLKIEHRINKNQKSNEIYDCKQNAILREFADTAADTRLLTAQNVPMPKLKKINEQAAKVYLHVRNELRKLPKFNCNKLLKGG